MEIPFEDYTDDLDEQLLVRLGFCGCGIPDDCMLFVRDYLELMKKRSDENDDLSTTDTWMENSKKMDDLIREHPRELEYIFYYWLDDKRLTEHGGSVPGWIDGDGYEVLDKLNQWSEENK